MGKEYKNTLQKHTYSIPALVLTQADALMARCAAALSGLPRTDLRRVVITGCGYSYAAGLAVEGYLRALGLPLQVLPAMDAARFTDPQPGDLLIAISNSGRVSRINEAAQRYRQRGSRVIALTADPAAPLTAWADAAVDISAPPIGESLPLRGYAMTILALLGIGHALTDTPPELSPLKTAMTDLEKCLPALDETIQRYLYSLLPLRGFEFVASGCERASAFLGKIEMLGQAGAMALEEDSEQWCHCNFFLSAPEAIGTVLFCAQNSPAASRNREALRYMLHLNRPVLAVTDDPDLPDAPGCTVLRLPPITNQNAALLELAAPSLLTGHYCDLIGETYSRGFRNQWSTFQSGRGTCQSEIILL